MSISEVTVKGTYKKADGSPETGTVKFRPALWQQSGSGIDAVLDSSGSFQTKFPSSDSGNWPDGLQIPYRVTVAVSSGTYVKDLTFKTADSPIDLPTLFPIVSADSGGSGGGGGGDGSGVPAAHAATHSPGGSDPLPELARIGNLLPPGQAQCTSLADAVVNGGQAVEPGGLVWTIVAGASGYGSVWWGGSSSVPNRRWGVAPGPTTFQLRAAATAATQTAASYVRWYDRDSSPIGGTMTLAPAVALGPTPVDIGGTLVAPEGAAYATVRLQIAVAPEQQIVRISRVGVWLGAGGEWRPPGEPIPNLGFRTTKLNNAELLSVWQGGKWIPLSGDTGTFTVGNGTIRRVGNSVYLTATGYTPPTGFKPAQGGTAPPNVWYVTVDDWPTSAPGSAKLSNSPQ